MRVLFFMSHAGQARNFEWTVRGLADRGHEVHLAFDKMAKRNLAGLSDLADSLVQEYPQVTSGAVPQVPKADWAWVSSRLRASLDYMRYLEPEFENAPKLRRRAQRFAPGGMERLVTAAPEFARSHIRSALRRAEQSAPISEPVERYVREQQADAVLVTPLLEPGSVQVEFLRAANRLDVPTCLCVASWDNLTNKGLIHERPDAITVWNDMQRDEAVKLHGVPAEQVVVTGAVPYDHWYGWEPSLTREEFMTNVGLDPERPFVLYVGSSGFIAPDEAGFVVEWLRELEAHGLEDIQVLARPHPVNPLLGDTPSQVELAAMENVKLYPPKAENPTDAESRRHYFDSLYFCSAVAGVNTTAFLEAAILGRPVYTFLAPRYRETQEGMLHFHHLLNAGGGLLHVADDYDEHAASLREALAAPHPEGCVSDRSRKFTEAFIRPYGLDQPATPRMLDTIESLPERRNGASAPGRPTIGGAVLARGARALVKIERRRRLRAKHKKDSIERRQRAEKRRKVARAETDKREQRALKASKVAEKERKAARAAEKEKKAAEKAKRDPGTTNEATRP